jgi:hypothetical protein
MILRIKDSKTFPVNSNLKFMVLLSISWEKGVQESRIQGTKSLLSNDLKPFFNFMNPILYSVNNQTLNLILVSHRTACTF